jgi:CheY-like chemotaxis protein
MGNEIKSELRVIVVEDDPLDARLMEMSLHASLCCHVVVVNSREAFESEIEHATPDVIISDSNLPKFDGEVARSVALQHCPQVPFIFYSGADRETLKEKALLLRAHAWLHKNDLDRLGDLVRKICGR